MRPRILLVLSLLLSFAAAAPPVAHAQSDSADLSVEFEFPQEEHLTATYFQTWTRIRNAGPATAHGLTITADAPGASAIGFFQTYTHCEGASTCTTTFGDLAPGAYVEFSVAFELRSAIETTVPLTVRVSSSNSDPNPDNNVVTQSEVFVDLPLLRANVSSSNDRLEPELPTTVTFGVRNDGRTAALGTTVELTLPAGSEVLTVTPLTGVTCTSTTTTVSATRPSKSIASSRLK